MTGPIGLAEIVHAIAASALVGSQLLATVLLAAGPEPGSSSWERLGRAHRAFGLASLLVAFASGGAYLELTLVSRAILSSTPYGPLLALKVALALAMAGHLLLAPLAGMNGRGRGVTWGVLGSAIAIAIVVVSHALPYA